MRSESLSDFRRKFMFSFYLFLIVLFSGTMGYWLINAGRHSVLECLYMTVITVSTVGYGEIIDTSQSYPGRLFTILLIFSGMSIILYFMSNVTAFLVEGNLKEIFWRKKMRKLIESMKGHYIVCGSGTLGEHIVQELHSTGRAAVIIDRDPERAAKLAEKFSGVAVLPGDATEEEVLREAGLERAAGLLAATNNDNDNLVVTITAKQIRPDLRIITRCSEIKHTEKLKRAGASAVVSSNYIGALRMASEMVRPSVVSFLDNMLRDKEKNLRIEELRVPKGSPAAGRSVAEIRRHVLLLAIIKQDGSYEFNPDDGFQLGEDMVLVFMGRQEDKAGLERAVATQAK